MNQFRTIVRTIEGQLKLGRKKYVIYPFGQIGMEVKKILNSYFGINEYMIIDDNAYKYNQKIMPSSALKNMDVDIYILLATDDETIKNEILKVIDIYNRRENTIVIFPEIVHEKENINVGKYSYGPICKSWMVESIGAFCCFAGGTAVLPNHSKDLISSHPFLYMGKDEVHSYEYSDYKDRPWYFDGVIPKGKPHKLKKSIIGNDVWLGQNVLITNGSNIGNGVIAAAGAVITKDVPDYAIVMGIPARVVGFRYGKKEIEALNRIQWWNWSDEKIRECYEDFFLPIEEFIEKHDGDKN